MTIPSSEQAAAAEIDRLRAGIQEALASIEGGPCTFWACDGPDAGLVPMKTCNVCAAVIELRELLTAGAR